MSGDITAVVLAGGLGRRMGGVDKGLQLLEGRPLVAWVLDRLRPQVSSILINANRNQDRYAAFGYPVVPDLVPDFAGPLAGLHAAMSLTEAPLVLCVPCDSPHLPPDLVARLSDALEQAQGELAVASDGEREHPVFCLARRELLPSLGDYLAAGERRLALWQGRHRKVVVRFDDAGAFANFNTLDDLRP